MSPRVYLDNNATTFLDPRVLKVLAHHYQSTQGNPSSVHTEGREVRGLLNKARRDIADYLKVKPSEIIFTSGGTEGLNMILRGVFSLNSTGHLITSSVEHASVYTTAKALAVSGYPVTFLEPGLRGAVTCEAVKNALRSETRLIALMAVNNETGVKTDIKAIADFAQEAKIPFLVDGVGLLGKEEFQIPEGVSAMCFSGHKFHAPLGIGFSYIRSTLRLNPCTTGGEQEFGRRGGTENIPSILALQEAIQILRDELPEASKRMGILRNKLETNLINSLGGISINGEGSRIVNTSNLSFDGIDGESLLTFLDMEGIAVSHGSACASGALEPSRVLLNMGIAKRRAASSIRISLSRFTTEQEIDRAVETIIRTITKLKK